MITIGLTTWTDHPAFTDTHRPPTLTEYARFLPTVELDTPFYALPNATTVLKWRQQVPRSFQFVLKANRLMTQHDQRGQDVVSMAVRQQTAQAFCKMVQPLVATGQLKTILFQFPPFFRATAANLDYLAQLPKWLPELPITVEFRHPSWYQPTVVNRLVGGLKQLHITLAVVDEPHNLNDGIPFVPVVTNPRLSFIRLHGRNAQGWFHQGPDWRAQRTRYRYNEHELGGLDHQVATLAMKAHEVCVIFNNNSGKDAAPNALRLQQLLGIHFTGLAPRQLDLF